MNATDWWADFFTGPFIDMWAGWFTPDQTKAHADKVEEILALPKGSKLLDVPCGEGRIARELAARGYPVTGVDITGRLLEVGRERAAEAGAEVEFVQADMREIQWEAEFDGVYNWLGSFGYFDDEGNLDFLKAAYRALKPGGKFLVDGHIAETLFPIFQARDWRPAGEHLLLEERRWDHERGRIVADWTLLVGGEPHKRVVDMRIYTYRELVEMVGAAGFDSWEPHDWVTEEPFTGLGSRRLGLVATKGSAG